MSHVHMIPDETLEPLLEYVTSNAVGLCELLFKSEVRIISPPFACARPFRLHHFFFCACCQYWCCLCCLCCCCCRRPSLPALIPCLLPFPASCPAGRELRGQHRAGAAGARAQCHARPLDVPGPAGIQGPTRPALPPKHALHPRTCLGGDGMEEEQRNARVKEMAGKSSE